MYQFGKSKWSVVCSLSLSFLLLSCAHTRARSEAAQPRVAEHMVKPTVIPPAVVMIAPPDTKREDQESVITSSVDLEAHEPLDPEP